MQRLAQRLSAAPCRPPAPGSSCASRGGRRTPVRRSSPLAGSPAAAYPAGCGSEAISAPLVLGSSDVDVAPAFASPTRAAFKRLGLRGVLNHVLAGSARGADLPREPCRFVCEPGRAGCPGHCWRFADAAPRGRRRECTYGRARLLSAAHIGGERTSACGWSVSLSLLAVPCPSALLRSCTHSHRRMPTGVARARAWFRARRRSASP